MSHATTRRYSRANSANHAGSRRPVLIFVGVLIAIVLTFYGLRIATDAPFLLTGTEPEPEDFESVRLPPRVDSQRVLRATARIRLYLQTHAGVPMAVAGRQRGVSHVPPDFGIEATS